MLNQCLESLAQKVQSGVVINFEKTGPDPVPNVEGTYITYAFFRFYYSSFALFLSVAVSMLSGEQGFVRLAPLWELVGE